MKRYLTLGLLLAMVLAAPTAYYPNSIGYSWTYSSGMEQVFTSEQNGLLVFERRLAKQPVSADLLRYTENGVFLEGLIIGQAVQRYTPPLQLYPAPPLVIGQEWGGRSSFGGQSVALNWEGFAHRGRKRPGRALQRLCDSHLYRDQRRW